MSLRRAGNERLIYGGSMTPASRACGPARHDGQLARLDVDGRFRGRSAVRRLPACRSWSGFGQSPAARRATRTRTVSRRSQTKTDQLPRHDRHFLAETALLPPRSPSGASEPGSQQVKIRTFQTARHWTKSNRGVRQSSQARWDGYEGRLPACRVCRQAPEAGKLLVTELVSRHLMVTCSSGPQ